MTRKDGHLPIVFMQCGVAELERSKSLLWYGNQHRAQESICILEDDVDGLEADYPNLRRFAKSVHDFVV
jgi:hypothetical protein